MNDMNHRKALKAYYAEGDSWARDQQDGLRKSRKVAWIMAGAATTVAVCEGFALMFLMPLKTVQPYTLMVDRQTGFVQLLKPLEPERISGDTALTQSLLVQYVIARESFDISTLNSDYRKIALWSADRARSDYLARMPVSNPDSPLAQYPRTTTIETMVKSVSPLGPGTAIVRFETRRRDAGADVGQPRAWMAVIHYRFSGEPMAVEDRYINPLGFQVTSYRRNVEVLPAVEPAAVPASPANPTAMPTGASVPPVVR